MKAEKVAKLYRDYKIQNTSKTVRRTINTGSLTKPSKATTHKNSHSSFECNTN